MKQKMWDIKSFNFTLFQASETTMEEVEMQMDAMCGRCAVNTVTFAFAALQDHCTSTTIDWKGPHMFCDEDIREMIRMAKRRNLKTIVKPMLNVRDGYWRAHIRFFDEDVPCEPKWRDWFKSYMEYIVHFAELCEQENADMLIIGCEMVGTDHRQEEWRTLIQQVREVYTGLLTYNCDKYQEHNVKWWDALDVISSSGYYPETDWDQQLDRIHAVVSQYQLPFFFSEAGCPSSRAAAMVPNDWTVIGHQPVDHAEQERYFQRMFEKCSKLSWHYGYCIWEWPAKEKLNAPKDLDGDYNVAGKAAEKTVRECYELPDRY